MAKRLIGKAKPKTVLWWIGLWATLWWAVSGLFVAWLFWESRGLYVSETLNSKVVCSRFKWSTAIWHTYTSSRSLEILSILIIIVWIVGFFVWLQELKRKKISLKEAFKDLFLTIRK
jgi:hypothetical protein